MKKILLFVLCVMLVLTACTQGEETNKAPVVEKPTEEAKPAENKASTFPLSEQKETIKVMIVQNPTITDLVDNEFTKWYEEKTNVHVEWEIVQPSHKQEKLNLALSSGEYPEVLINFGVSPSQQMVYGNQGVFLSLNNLIDQYGVETKSLLEKYPEVKKAITAPGGNIYALPTVDRNPHVMMFHKMWIYTPWLEKLNLKMPQTTEEFYQVLKAFKEQDPNGNGLADEIPLIGASAGAGPVPIEEFIMNSFILHNSDYMIFDDQGNIDVNFNKPAWKEGLVYLNKLYSEGLIASETFVQNRAQMKERVENPGVPIVGAVRANALGQVANLKGPRAQEYKTVPPLEGPDGYRVFPYDHYMHAGGNFIITNKAKNPELIFRWMDSLLNEEMTVLANIGLEGVGWEKAAPDAIGLSGGPATWTRLIQGGESHNKHWGQMVPYHFSRELFEGLSSKETEQPYILYTETKNNYEPYKAPIEDIVPPIFFDESQAYELADLDKTIKDYVKEMLVRFTIGDASIQEDWGKYLETINGMNLERYLEIYNEAYKAQYK